MQLRKTMNWGLRLALPGIRPVVATLAALAFAHAGALGAAAARVDKTEEAVLLGREAFRTGNAPALARAAAQARGHVLEPYVEYWQLRQKLDDRSREEVRDYLARHQGSYLAERLRGEWLKSLGKKSDWDAFRAERPALVNEDAEIACLGLLNRFRAGDASALAELKTQWHSQGELPEGCAPLAAEQLRTGEYGVAQIWARFRVLVEAGQTAAAKRVLNALPAKEQPANGTIDRVLAAPSRYLLQLPDSATTRTARELVIFGLTRLARSDPQAAAERWNESLRVSFSAEDQGYVWGQIALWGARRHLPEAVGWFSRAAMGASDDEQLAWRVRIALRGGAWPEVRAAVDAMSAQARAQSTWIYWRARALKMAGRDEEARAELARITAEFSFYGLLAAEELGMVFKLPQRPAAPAAEELVQSLALPGLQRALALFRLDMRTEAVREWNWSLRGMDDRQLIAAAEIARRHEVWDRAINTADRTVAQHDFGLRYLAPYQQVLTSQARAQRIEEHWVLGLVRQESRFIWNAKSSAGAAGLMQLMPATARWVAGRMGMKDFNWARVTTVELNAALGSYYLKTVLEDLGGAAGTGLRGL